jgi:hypothetical protein
MKFQPEHLKHAARERLDQSNTLFREGAFALAMYTAGVGVECMLRAYILRQRKDLATGHDIPLLFKTSGLILRAEHSNQRGRGTTEKGKTFNRQLQADIIDIHQRWANDFRYASEDRLRAHLKHKRLDIGIKGDLLRINSRQLIDAAKRVVDLGDRLWTRYGKK